MPTRIVATLFFSPSSPPQTHTRPKKNYELLNPRLSLKLRSYNQKFCLGRLSPSTPVSCRVYASAPFTRQTFERMGLSHKRVANRSDHMHIYFEAFLIATFFFFLLFAFPLSKLETKKIILGLFHKKGPVCRVAR